MIEPALGDDGVARFEAPPHRRFQIAFGDIALLLIGMIAFALFAVTIERTPLPWFDEVLFASASRSETTVPTVLGAFSSERFDLFYGPLGTTLGAWTFELFGFSASSFRFLSLTGAILIAVSSWAIVRSLTGSSILAGLSFALVAISPQIGVSATSGRLDTVTVGLQLAGLFFYSREGRSWFLAGPVWALAVLSGPRAFPFIAAVALAVIVLERLDGLRRLVPVLLTILGGVWIWTASQGMNPFDWLRHISSVSTGDSVNSSPFLGGAWAFSASIQSLITPLFVILLLPFVKLADSKRRLLFMAVAGNALLTVLLISRPFSYSIFWLLPMIPVLLAVSRITRSTLALWCLLAFAFAGVRLAKTSEIFVSWHERNPRIVENFVEARIPSGSVVYGPEEYFYYAVEKSGSAYRFVKDSPAAGLRSAPGTKPQFENGYLIWPKARPLPAHFDLEAIAEYEAKPASSLFKRLNKYSGGYPSFVLYHATPR